MREETLPKLNYKMRRCRRSLPTTSVKKYQHTRTQSLIRYREKITKIVGKQQKPGQKCRPGTESHATSRSGGWFEIQTGIFSRALRAKP